MVVSNYHEELISVVGASCIELALQRARAELQLFLFIVSSPNVLFSYKYIYFYLVSFALNRPVFESSEVVVVDWRFGDSPYPILNVTSGDTILFQWETGHDVRKFQNKNTYENCEFSGRWMNEENTFDGPLEYIVNEVPGSAFYVGCSVDGHCKF